MERVCIGWAITIKVDEEEAEAVVCGLDLPWDVPIEEDGSRDWTAWSLEPEDVEEWDESTRELTEGKGQYVTHMSLKVKQL